VELRKKAPWAVIAAATGIFGAVNFVSYFYQVRYIERFTEDGLADIASDVTTSLNSKAGVMWGEIVATLPETKAALKEHDRGRLVHELQAAYKVENSRYTAQIGAFQSPELKTSLRLARPDLAGDDVSSREMVVKANKERKTQSGLETSVLSVSLRSIVPVTDADGKPAGSFEWGFPLSRTFQRLKDQSNAESGLFVDETKFAAPPPSLTAADKARVEALRKAADADRIVDGYRTVESTDVELMRHIVSRELLDVTEKRPPHKQRVGDIDYGVIAVPVHDFSDRRIGTIVVAKSLAESQRAIRTTRITFIAATIAGLILLAGAVQVVFNGLLIRPLLEIGENADAMAGATPPGKIDLKTRDDEIGSIAKSLESLRARLAAEKAEAEQKARVTEHVKKLEAQQQEEKK